jgi:hypothetical protein
MTELKYSIYSLHMGYQNVGNDLLPRTVLNTKYLDMHNLVLICNGIGREIRWIGSSRQFKTFFLINFINY